MPHFGELEDTAGGAGPPAADVETFQLALSDLATAITAAVDVGYFDAPYACTLTEVIWTLLVASSSGVPQLGVKKNGTTMLSTNVTIDATETSSLTAATPPVISVTAIAKGDRITFAHIAVGTGAKGSQATLVVTRP